MTNKFLATALLIRPFCGSYSEEYVNGSIFGHFNFDKIFKLWGAQIYIQRLNV